MIGALSARRLPRALALTCLTTLAVTGLAACGGDDGAPSADAASATVIVKDVAGFGEALATNAGDPVYILTSDPENGSSCTGACAETWPPLTPSGEATAGPDVDGSKLTTFEREDGTTQVAYAGHALYTHKEPGLVAGTESDGGTWFLIDPSGEAIERTAGGGY